MKPGCRAELITGMHWCVVHGSDWPSRETYCDQYKRLMAQLAQKRALTRALKLLS